MGLDRTASMIDSLFLMSYETLSKYTIVYCAVDEVKAK